MLINESLYESYQSHKEIEVLASYLIKWLCHSVNTSKRPIRNMNSIAKIINEKEYDIKAVAKVHNFTEILDFVMNSDVAIQYEKLTDSSRGEYFDKEKLIVIYIPFIDRMYNSYLNTGTLDISKIIYELDPEHKMNPYISIKHELQHAYDDYRSKGMFKNTKEFHKYDKMKDSVVDKVKRGLMRMVDKNYNSEKDIDRYKKYLNLPHEINARFTGAIDRIEFISNNKFLSFDDVLAQFKKDFFGFNNLKQDYKNRLIKKLYQFYNNLKEENSK